MSDKKITQLPASTTPLAGSEVLPIVQSSTTRQVSVANLTAGRDVSARNLYTTENLGVGTTTPATVNGYLYPWRAFQVSAPSDVLAVVNGGTGAARLLLTGNGLADQRTWGFQQFGGNLTIAKYADNQASTTSLEFTQNSDVKVNAGNLVMGTAGKGIVDSTNAVALNFSSSGATLNSTLSQTGAINIVTNDFSSHVTAMNLNDTLTITGLTTGVIEISEMTFWQNLAVIAVSGASTAIVYASDAAITVSSGNAGTINVYRSGANVIIESKNAATLSVRTNIRKLG